METLKICLMLILPVGILALFAYLIHINSIIVVPEDEYDIVEDNKEYNYDETGL